MLHIQLKGQAGAHIGAESVTYVRCVGRYMHAGPDDRPIGRHTMGLWEVGAQSFVSITISGPLTATFQDGDEDRRDFGPFPAIRFTEGYMKAGEDFQQLIAHFRDVPERWTIMESGEQKAILLIRPATEA